MDTRELLEKQGLNILIIGLGARTGLCTANFLNSRGFDVTVSDNQSEEKLSSLVDQLADGVKTILGHQHPAILDYGYELVVLSPGVPQTIPLVKAIREKNIPLIAEVELAYHYMQGSWLAITGTDGKSTTTAWTDHILEQMGIMSRAGGNIGIPLISLVDDSCCDSVTVAELSSFQLETIEHFRPSAAAFLNLAPDHLDRYDSMDEYLRAKLRIAQNMGPDDYFVYNLDDEVVTYEAQQTRCRLLSFSLLDGEASLYMKDGAVYMNHGRVSEKVIDTSELPLPGRHNIQNFMAAFLLTYAYHQKRGLSFSISAAVMAAQSFKGLSHRLEPLGSRDGVSFINDSKATTVNAVKTALASMDEPVHLIFGGRSKGESYDALKDDFRTKLKSLVLIGETADEFSAIFAELEPLKASSMEDAVRIAFESATSGETVLLSPGCTSFDMFTNYEVRGEVFRGAVGALLGEVSHGS